MRIVTIGWMAALVLAGPVSAQTVSLPPTVQKSLDAQLVKALTDTRVAPLRALLEKGADPNTLIEGKGGVLHVAAAAGRLDLVRALLDHGANAIQRNESLETAREVARKRGFAQVAEVLRTAEDGTYPVPAPKLVVPASKYVSPIVPSAPRRPARPLTAAEKQARAYRKLQDYHYVKQNFGRW